MEGVSETVIRVTAFDPLRDWSLDGKESKSKFAGLRHNMCTLTVVETHLPVADTVSTPGRHRNTRRLSHHRRMSNVRCRSK